MNCTSCGTAATPGQKFCSNCGSAIAAAPAATPNAPAPGSSLPPPSFEPPRFQPDPAHAATSALNVVEQTEAPAGGSWDVPPGGAWSTTTGEVPVGGAAAVPMSLPFRITPLVIVATLSAACALIGCALTIWSIKIDGQLIEDGKINYDNSNSIVALAIAAALLIGGAALGATGRRIGSGLAGGAGLAVAGFVLFQVVGSTATIFDAATVGAGSGALGGTTLTTTAEVGYFVFVAAAVFGAITFVLSLAHQGPDGRNRMSQGVAAVGALATVAAVVGPLIPREGASFSDNFSNDFVPPIFFYLRLALLALVLITGLWGFFHGRRWGIGLALGGVSIVFWQWASAQLELGDLDIGPAGGNPGSIDLTPHVVTAIGVVGVVVLCLISLLVASQASQRQP